MVPWKYSRDSSICTSPQAAGEIHQNHRHDHSLLGRCYGRGYMVDQEGDHGDRETDGEARLHQPRDFGTTAGAGAGGGSLRIPARRKMQPCRKFRTHFHRHRSPGTGCCPPPSARHPALQWLRWGLAGQVLQWWWWRRNNIPGTTPPPNTPGPHTTGSSWSTYRDKKMIMVKFASGCINDGRLLGKLGDYGKHLSAPL